MGGGAECLSHLLRNACLPPFSPSLLRDWDRMEQGEIGESVESVDPGSQRESVAILNPWPNRGTHRKGVTGVSPKNLESGIPGEDRGSE